MGVKGMTTPCMTHAPDALEKGFNAGVETYVGTREGCDLDKDIQEAEFMLILCFENFSFTKADYDEFCNTFQ